MYDDHDVLSRSMHGLLVAMSMSMLAPLNHHMMSSNFDTIGMYRNRLPSSTFA